MAYTPLGKSNTSGGAYQPLGKKVSLTIEESREDKKQGSGRAFTRAAAFQAVPTTGAIASGVAGAKGGALLGSFAGPIGAAVGGVAGAVVGGIAGAILTSKAQEKALEIVKGEEWMNKKQEQLAQARKERPLATFAGEVAPQLLTLKPSPQTVVRATKFAQQILTNPKSVATILKTPAGQAQLDDLINVSIGGVSELGTEAYTQAKEGDLNAIRLIAAGTVGSLINQPNRFGMRIGLKPSGEVEVLPERRVPVIGDDNETPIPISTPRRRHEDYARREGYEPITPDEQLPSIQIGARTRQEIIPSISPDTPLRVDLPVEERLARLTPEQNKEVLRETRSLFGRGMDYQTAREVALTRFEARQTSPTSGAEVIPETPTTPPRTKINPTGAPQTPKTTPETRVEPIDEIIIPETRTTTVPREQLPVGEEGTTRVSRLEARIKGALDNTSPAKAEEAGITTYQQMKKPEQIKRATEYVEKSPDDALAVLRGDKPAPEGLLHNSIALALEQKAADTADANLAIKLASLRSTRAGQEISILTEADPSNPVNVINEIIKARTAKLEKARKTTRTKAVAKEVSDVSAEVSKKQLKIAEAEELLAKLLC